MPAHRLRDFHSSTVPQRIIIIIIIIDNRVRTGLVPTVVAAGQCRSRGRRGRDFAIGIHLNQALELSKPPGPRQIAVVIDHPVYDCPYLACADDGIGGNHC